MVKTFIDAFRDIGRIFFYIMQCSSWFNTVPPICSVSKTFIQVLCTVTVSANVEANESIFKEIKLKYHALDTNDKNISQLNKFMVHIICVEQFSFFTFKIQRQGQ